MRVRAQSRMLKSDDDLLAGFNAMALLMRPPGCREWPALSPRCNMAAYLDAALLGRGHLYPYPSCRKADPPCEYMEPEVIPCFVNTLRLISRK